MADSRIDSLKQMLEKNPDDSFAKYAIGLEYMSLNKPEMAKEMFESLRVSDPKYSATYYQLGKVYEILGENQMAGKVYEQGIFVTTQQGDDHARSELEQAINELL